VNKTSKERLIGTTLLAGFASLGLPLALGAASVLTPTDAHAQTQPTPTPAPAPVAEEDDEENIVVTGTIFRNNTNSVSPVTVVDQEALETRGVNTVQDAIQTLTANNGPALTNSFSANGAFAGGASGASLRGLTVNSTLVLFDGLRAAYYPLADDGTRNFVDLNTIPDDIVERIEVLRDGASSTYGADAIAGVINIITKREFQGVQARAEGGLSSRGDAAQSRLGIMLGAGDLQEDGINAYISAFRYNSDILYNRDRPFPFNTQDWSTICLDHCNSNFITNGIQYDDSYGGLSTGANFMLRPGTRNPVTGAVASVGGSRYQHASDVDNLGCPDGGTEYVLTPAQLAGGGAVAPANGLVCQYDYANRYFVIQPDVDRWGLSGRATAVLDNEAEVYVEANFLESTVQYTGNPAVWRGPANNGVFFPRFRSDVNPGAGVAPQSFILNLPVYVCGAGSSTYVCDGTEADAVLNPQNPFAGAGNVALLIGRWHDPSQVTYTETRNRAYRVAGGLTGTFANNWDYDLAATAMHVDLRRYTDGYLYIENFVSAIRQGRFNFADPAATPQNVIDFITPPNDNLATSDQMQLQGSISIPVMELAGGTMQFALGASARYEAVDAPSANSDFSGPTQRFMTLNAFGTTGTRHVYSAFMELDAPVLPMLDVNLSGRFDEYSSGQDAFSPKVGLRFRPIDQLTLRATYSEGFRIPSFAEANAFPTTGFVGNTAGLFNDPYLAQYGCTTATFATCPIYIRGGSYGLTTLASPDLEPEESTSHTIGVIFEPFNSLTIAVDYYEIEKTGAITGANCSAAIAAYYTGGAIPPECTVIADAPDPNFPLAQPRIAFVQSQQINSDTINVRGYDFSIDFDTDLTDTISFRSSLDASLIDRLSTTFPDGTTQRYDGTLGNFNLTAGSGTPKWRGTWTNTLDFGMFDVTGTVNYFDGYTLTAEDQIPDSRNDCDLSLSSGDIPCEVDEYITYDITGRAHLNDNVTLYLTVLNVADEMPPIDTVTYGAWGYNPVQGGTGILGRYFRAGVRLNF